MYVVVCCFFLSLVVVACCCCAPALSLFSQLGFDLRKRAFLMWWQLAPSVLPATVVAFIGTADLQRKYKVVACIVVIQFAVFEPPASMTCPSHATTPDADEPDSSDQGISFGPLRPLDWQLLRLAIVLHCILVCGKLVRAGWYGVTWSWQQLFQAQTIYMLGNLRGHDSCAFDLGCRLVN